MTVAELKKALAKLGPEHDNHSFIVWLPGTRIDVLRFMMMESKDVVFEGNVRATREE